MYNVQRLTIELNAVLRKTPSTFFPGLDLSEAALRVNLFVEWGFHPQTVTLVALSDGKKTYTITFHTNQMAYTLRLPTQTTDGTPRTTVLRRN